MIVVQRLRDYFNPILAENSKWEDDYKRFVLAVLILWTETKSKFLLSHLVELASTDRFAIVFVEYMRTQMQSLLAVLSEEDSTVSEAQALKVLHSFQKLQAVYMRVLLFASGKIMDNLLQLAGLLYKKLGHMLVSESLLTTFESLLKDEIRCMEKQQSKYVFNNNINFACQLLPGDHSLRARWG